MRSDIFHDAIVFKAGRQVLLFSTFDMLGLRFPADWHSNFGKLFLSIELLPYTREPFNFDLNYCESALGIGSCPSWGRIITYSGFCTYHSYYDHIGDQDDHIFYQTKNGKDIRGVEVIVSGRSRTDCRGRMRSLLSEIKIHKFVEYAYSQLNHEWSGSTGVSNSNIEGKGVMSKRDVAPKTEIEWLARPLVRYSRVPKKGQKGYGHNIQVERGWWLLLSHSPFYHLNHNCNPNALIDFKGPVAIVKSLRTIKSGEEITVDYSQVIYSDDALTFKCLCRNTNCRGWIKGVRT